MAQVNVHEAKTHLSKLLARVAAGDEIVIARGGKGSRGRRRAYPESLGQGQATQRIGDTIPILSTLARKFGDVFCSDHAAFGRVASLSRSASRSRRVKRHWNGLATAW